MPLDEEALASFHDGINVILDLTDAYRSALLGRGYSPTAAEVMTMHYHENVWKQQASPPKGRDAE